MPDKIVYQISDGGNSAIRVDPPIDTKEPKETIEFHATGDGARVEANIDNGIPVGMSALLAVLEGKSVIVNTKRKGKEA